MTTVSTRITALAAHSTPARVLGHSGSDCNQPTWMILKPGAFAVLERAMYEVSAGQHIMITGYAPDADLKENYHQGNLQLHHPALEGRRLKYLMVAQDVVTEVNPNIRAIKNSSTEQIRIAGAENSMPDALLTAALLTESGHDVMLWTDGVVFEVRDLGTHVPRAV